MPRRDTPLDSGWTLHQHRRADGAPDVAPVPATVPGCTHTDLFDAGVIPDPFIDTNEQAVAWVAECDWRYTRTLTVTPDDLAHEHVELVFDGLDTLATIVVNGSPVGGAANMHRRHRFDVRSLIVAGDNTLDVVFASATAHAEALRDSEGVWPSSSFGRPFNYVRKMACSWGWDWGPWLTSAGIWRPARLEAWSTARLGDIRPHVRFGDAGEASVRVEIDVHGATDLVQAKATLRDPDGAVVTSGSGSGIVELDAGEVRRWWPHTHGDQPLYELTIELVDADGAHDVVHDRRTQPIGFRTIELDTSIDPVGSAFTIVVNGRPIFARGVNWIPDDVFPTRITEADYRRRLGQAAAANADLVRVWGGGLYEDDRFYAACDELGLLVWQDFPFACAAYPEHLLATEVEAEARDNISRLMAHPSLAIWNGNNENIWGYWDWAWQPVLDGRAWGAGFYFDLLPRLCAELDPTRAYWPGSPYSGSQDVFPNADAQGCVHTWKVWNEVDLVRYRDHAPRFVSEFGWQAPPAWTTMADAVSADRFTRDSPEMRNHQKADDGDRKLDRGIVPRFGEIARLEDWWYAAQVVQARALRTGVEHFRSLRPWCMGTIWWQLNDCWPVASWAVVDGAGRLKPAWYAMRDAYRSRLITFQPRGDELTLVAINETSEPWVIDTVASRTRFDGEVSSSAPVSLSVAPFSVEPMVLPRRLATPTDPNAEVLVAGDPDERAWWWFLPDRELRLRRPEWRVSERRDGDDLVLTITADTVVRDLVVQADRIDPAASVDRQLVTFLPGEPQDIRLSGAGPADAARLLAESWNVADLVTG